MDSLVKTYSFLEMFLITNTSGIVIYVSLFIIFLFLMIMTSILASNTTQNATTANINYVHTVSIYSFVILIIIGIFLYFNYSKLFNKFKQPMTLIILGIFSLIILLNVLVLFFTADDKNISTVHTILTYEALSNALILFLIILGIIINILLVVTPIGRSIMKAKEIGDVFVK